MSTEVEIHLVAYDEASTVLAQVGSNFDATFTDIEGNVQGLTAQTEEANGSLTESLMTMNGLAMSSMGLAMSFEQLQKSQYYVDKANLTLERSTNAVQKAQDAYNQAVEKYGSDSPQAQAALQKLQTAQDALSVAQEHAGLAQRNMNNTMLLTAMSVIPSLVSIIGLVSNATEIWEGIQAGLNAVMDANPIFLVIGLVAGLAAGIVYLYNTCAPVRDAINDIGNALKWVGDLILGELLGAVHELVGGFNAIAGAFSGFFSWVGNGLHTLTNDITGTASAAQDSAEKVTSAVQDMTTNTTAAANSMTHSVTDAINNENVAFADAHNKAGAMHAEILNEEADAAAVQAQCAKDAATELTNLSDKYDLLQAAASKALPFIQKEFGTAFNSGDMQTALNVVQAFADKYNISLSDAEKTIDDFKAAQATVPESIEEQLVEKAQGDMQNFKDCMTGKMAGLNDDGSKEMNQMTGDITHLIKHGLVGEAQSAMQDYVNCSSNKVSDMVLSINDDMTKLTTDQNKKLQQMKDLAATLTGQEKDTVLTQIDDMTRQYNSKMEQLKTWQAQLLNEMNSNVDDSFGNMTETAIGHASRLSTQLVATSIWTDMLEMMVNQTDDNLGKVEKRFLGMSTNVEAAVPNSLQSPGIGSLGGSTAKTPVTVNVNAPLVYVEGSADKATVDLASKQVLDQLRTIIVEPTSVSAASTQKRIRKGSVLSS